MKKSVCLLVFVSAFALAYATSQTTPPTSSTNPSPAKPPNPVGSEQTPSATSNNWNAGISGQNSDSTNNQTHTPSASSGAATQTASSGNSSSITQGATAPSASPEPPASPASSENTITAGQLQSQIQNALKNEPTLANDSVNVTVSDEEIDLAGSVATAKEKLTAKRIVQSFAENRKVKDHLTLASHNPQ